MSESRNWTIYITQDKHLDYNWCGTQSEIEVRMAMLMDGYLALAEENKSRWNMDCTWWYEVYKRQRGPKGVERLMRELQKSTIGSAANVGVLQWGLLNTELSIYAFYKSLEVADLAGTSVDTALIMENPGMAWSVATAMTASGIPYLARGIYDLRAESYNKDRLPYPLFRWLAPDGKSVLVHWDLYADNYTWGGYAEAFQLGRIAGEEWNAMSVQYIANRNTDEVYAQRVDFVHKTVEHYESYDDAYPVSSILLLGTGWDNWVVTDDYAAFIRRFNAESDGRIKLVDATYEDYFIDVEKEILEESLSIPVLSGSFGITWEEWAAHLAAPTRDFRQASRLMVHAQAQYALEWLSGQADERAGSAIVQGVDACLRFAEHDFAGVDRRTAAISAGVRAGAAMEANTIFQALSSVQDFGITTLTAEAEDEALEFSWRDWDVIFHPDKNAITSLRDARGNEWVPTDSTLALGSFLHTLHREDQLPDVIIPDRLPHSEQTRVDYATCRRAANGVEIKTTGYRWGFHVDTHWFFHTAQPWIDITYGLGDGWSESPQTVQFCFPFQFPEPTYTYDMGGTILEVGRDDLPGANPVLYALQNYARITDESGEVTRSAILLSPDVPLVQFGADAVNFGGQTFGTTPSMLISLPMMNLTRNDWQFNQGGKRQWQFRYRLVLTESGESMPPPNPMLPLQQSQHFTVPPFLQMPGVRSLIPQLAGLDIHFEGGPVTALKRSQDGKRLILRLWNVLDHPVLGSVKIPERFRAAEITDALERPVVDADMVNGRIYFTAPAKSLLTIAFTE